MSLLLTENRDEELPPFIEVEVVKKKPPMVFDSIPGPIHYEFDFAEIERRWVAMWADLAMTGTHFVRTETGRPRKWEPEWNRPKWEYPDEPFGFGKTVADLIKKKTKESEFDISSLLKIVQKPVQLDYDYLLSVIKPKGEPSWINVTMMKTRHGKKMEPFRVFTWPPIEDVKTQDRIGIIPEIE